METFSALLAICEGNSPVTAEFPAQRPVTRSFDVFFDLRLNQRLSKHSWGWWYETPLRSLWRHCNVTRDIPLNWSVSQTTVGTSWIGIGSEAYLNNGFVPAIKRLQINVKSTIQSLQSFARFMTLQLLTWHVQNMAVTLLLFAWDPLQWRHNERHGSSNNRRLESWLIGRRSKKAPRHWTKCEGAGEFPAQKASNTENVPIWWRNHAKNPLACGWQALCVMVPPG